MCCGKFDLKDNKLDHADKGKSNMQENTLTRRGFIKKGSLGAIGTLALGALVSEPSIFALAQASKTTQSFGESDVIVSSSGCQAYKGLGKLWVSFLHKQAARKGTIIIAHGHNGATLEYHVDDLQVLSLAAGRGQKHYDEISQAHVPKRRRELVICSGPTKELEQLIRADLDTYPEQVPPTVAMALDRTIHEEIFKTYLDCGDLSPNKICDWTGSLFRAGTSVLAGVACAAAFEVGQPTLCGAALEGKAEIDGRYDDWCDV